VVIYTFFRIFGSESYRKKSALFQGKVALLPNLTLPPTNPQNGCGKSIEYYQLKAATLARECQEIFMTAIFTLHAGKAIVHIAAIEIAIDHLLDIGPPESVLT
jgi:hypothetical protein